MKGSPVPRWACEKQEESSSLTRVQEFSSTQGHAEPEACRTAPGCSPQPERFSRRNRGTSYILTCPKGTYESAFMLLEEFRYIRAPTAPSFLAFATCSKEKH